MKQVIIESHYLGSLEYYTLFTQTDAVIIPTKEVFRKQTYRNRCYILSANGILPLIIPLHYSSGIAMQDVQIDHRQRWKKDHWGAIYSAYGKAPFFDYFGEYFRRVIYKNYKFLIDFNQDLLELTLKLLQLNVNVTYSEEGVSSVNERFLNVILPKESYIHRRIYGPQPYSQLFGSEFSPNMSIVDLLMCEGPNSRQLLSASFLSQS